MSDMSSMSNDTMILSWEWDVLLFSVLLWVGFLLITGPYRKKFKDSEPITTKQKLFFFSGVVLFYIAEGSPLNMIGHHYLFSVHMVQQSLLYLVIPPLLLLGIPKWLMRAFIKKLRLTKVINFFTKPVIALFVFNGLFSFYHLPVVFDTVMASSALMSLSSLILFIAAIFMWFPLATPLPEFDHLSDLQKIGYIFADGVLLTPACALMAFSSEPMYISYLDAPRIFPIGLLDDQQAGGVIMKIIQELSYGTVLWFTFFRWFKKDRKKAEMDDIKRLEAVKKGLSARNI